MSDGQAGATLGGQKSLPGALGDLVSDGVGCDVGISLGHSGRRPNEAVEFCGPNTPQNTTLGEPGESQYFDVEFFRRMNDLNKEFTDNLRRNGTVKMGRKRILTLG